MQRFRVGRPSAPMVVGIVALVAALSGTAVALPGSNTVTSGDIKKGAVRTSDIKNSTIKSGDVKNGSLRAKDFKAGELPKGDKGDKGDKGATGAAGSALGYASVSAAGVLDATKSKNIAIVGPHATGRYCFVVPPSTKNIQVTKDLSGGVSNVEYGSLEPTDVTGYCPGLAVNAVAVVTTSANAFVNAGISVLIN